MATFSKARVAAVSAQAWVRIAEIFEEPDIGFMPHDLGNQAGIPYSVALAVLIAVGDDGLADLQWLIYHNCEQHPIAAKSFEDGFPVPPGLCPACERATERPEFRYDLRCKLRGRVSLE